MFPATADLYTLIFTTIFINICSLNDTVFTTFFTDNQNLIQPTDC